MASTVSTVDREIKLRNLKSKIIWVCCANLLSPPLKRVEPLRLGKEDSEAQKEYKRAEHARVLNERDMERIRREPELLKELERIMERVKQTRSEYTAPEVNYAIAATANVVFHYYCDRCKNQKEEEFELNHSTGDTICKLCGSVISEHFINHGAAKRNFEGEEDQNHFGPKPDQLMPDSWNMRTSIMTMKNGREDPIFKKLSRAHNEVEMNLSTIGCDERRTRLGYKNKQKMEAFELMSHVADNLGIHAAVVQRAKEEFAKYRDAREALQQYEGVVAACLVLAYQELSLVEDLDIRAATVIAALRTSAEGEPSNYGPSVDASDAAIATLTDVQVGKWDIDQVRQWVVAIGGSLYAPQSDAIINWVDDQLAAAAHSSLPSNNTNGDRDDATKSARSSSVSSSGGSMTADGSVSSAALPPPSQSRSRVMNKRKYPEITAKFLGTTTISGRNKKTYGVTLTNAVAAAATATAAVASSSNQHASNAAAAAAAGAGDGSDSTATSAVEGGGGRGGGAAFGAASTTTGNIVSSSNHSTTCTTTTATATSTTATVTGTVTSTTATVMIGIVKPQIYIPTAGNIFFGREKLLLPIFLERCPEASNNVLAADVFSHAVRRRVQFESQRKEASDLLRKETQRRRIEEVADMKNVVWAAASASGPLSAGGESGNLDALRGQFKKQDGISSSSSSSSAFSQASRIKMNQDGSHGGSTHNLTSSTTTISAEAKESHINSNITTTTGTPSLETGSGLLGLVDELEQLAGPPVNLSQLLFHNSSNNSSNAASTRKSATATAAAAAATTSSLGLKTVKTEPTTTSFLAGSVKQQQGGAYSGLLSSSSNNSTSGIAAAAAAAVASAAAPKQPLKKPKIVLDEED